MLIEEPLFNPQGNPVWGDNGYVKATFAYDERGYRIETAFFDEYSQPPSISVMPAGHDTYRRISVQIARNLTASVSHGQQRRRGRRANLHGMRTTGAEAASRGGINRIRRTTRERWALDTLVGVHRRRGGEEGLGIGVQRLGGDFFSIADLDDLAQIHH